MMNRRLFLGAGFLSIAVLLFKDKKVIGAASPIKTIELLQSDLFGYFANRSTIDYLENIILNHSKISDQEKSFIRNGSRWLNESSIEKYQKPYIKLTKSQREKLIKQISKTRWGDNWLYTIMGYLFEAILGDPIYGINQDEKGWKWLGFEPGLPRAKEAFL